MAEIDNPYTPPASDLLQPPVNSSTAAYVEGGRRVTSGHAWRWLKLGFTYFRRQAGMWLVLTFIFFVLLNALQFVPRVGVLAVSLFLPVVVAGLLSGCVSIERGGELELSHLFAGFRRSPAQLMLLGAFSLIGTFLATLPVSLTIPAEVFAGDEASAAAAYASGGFVISLLVALALFVPVNMALWFAPALVILQQQSAPRAVAQSFRGCLKNVLPFLIYGLILFAAAAVASIVYRAILVALATVSSSLPIVWRVLTIPVSLACISIVLASVYVAYREIYTSSAAEIQEAAQP